MHVFVYVFVGSTAIYELPWNWMQTVQVNSNKISTTNRMYCIQNSMHGFMCMNRLLHCYFSFVCIQFFLVQLLFRFVSSYFNCIVFISEIKQQQKAAKAFTVDFALKQAENVRCTKWIEKKSTPQLQQFSPKMIYDWHMPHRFRIFIIHCWDHCYSSRFFLFRYFGLLRWSTVERKYRLISKYVIFLAITLNGLCCTKPNTWIQWNTRKLESTAIIKTLSKAKPFAFSSFNRRKQRNNYTAELICGRSRIVWKTTRTHT